MAAVLDLMLLNSGQKETLEDLRDIVKIGNWPVIFRRIWITIWIIIWIALLIVVCGKSLYNKHFYNVNKHVGYDMTSTVTPLVQLANLEVKVLAKCKNLLGGRA